MAPNTTTITPTAAAIRLGYDLDYVYKLIRVGRLEAEKVGTQWNVSEAAVNARRKKLERAGVQVR